LDGRDHNDGTRSSVNAPLAATKYARTMTAAETSPDAAGRIYREQLRPGRIVENACRVGGV